MNLVDITTKKMLFHSLSLNLVGKGLYNCVLEWGEYEQSEIKTLFTYQIENYYGIKTYSRKEKLNKLNETFQKTL